MGKRLRRGRREEEKRGVEEGRGREGRGEVGKGGRREEESHAVSRSTYCCTAEVDWR